MHSIQVAVAIRQVTKSGEHRKDPDAVRQRLRYTFALVTLSNLVCLSVLRRQ